MAITAKYGSKTFEVSIKRIYTPDELSLNESINFEEEEIDGKKPTVKIKGFKLKDLQFIVKLDARFVNIDTEIKWWNDKLFSKKSEDFTLGNKKIGKFFLTGISQSSIVISKNGAWIKCELSLSFIEDGQAFNSLRFPQPSNTSKKISKGTYVIPKKNTRWFYTADGAYDKKGRYGKAYNKKLQVTYVHTVKGIQMINPQGLGWMRPEDVDVV